MTKSYKCWIEKGLPKGYREITDAAIIYGNNAMEAAEKYARTLFSLHEGKIGSPLDVLVKESNNHYAETLVYTITWVMEPKFNAVRKYVSVDSGHGLTNK